MTKIWPAFVTRDLGDSAEDDAEMRRRWETYDREMRAIIESGSAHQDEDGWWIDTATGELIGPDPEIERPLTEAELAAMRPLAEVLPELAVSIRRGRGPQRTPTKTQVSLRLSRDVIERFKAEGPGWQARIDATLRKAVGL